MKKVRNLLVVCLAALMLLSVVSIASAEGPSGTITMYYWDENQKPGMDAVIEMYEQETGVKVESTIIPWAQYWTKLQTSLPSENGPDVFWTNFSHAVDYFPAGLVEPLAPYVERDGVDLSPFPDVLKEMYSYEGQLHGLPKDYDTIALFYNKDLFDAKGIAYPTNDWTWDDLVENALALTDDSAYGFIAPPAGQTFAYSFILSNEGTMISEDRMQIHYDDPNTIEALQWMLDLIDVHGVSPTGPMLLELGTDDYFQAGLAAMVTGGSWMVPPYVEALGDSLGVARLPIAKKEANVIHGLSFCISANSQNKEAAWGLIKAFATKEAGEAQAKVVIPAYAGADQVWLANFPGLDLQCFIDATAYADLLPRCMIAAAAQDDIVASAYDKIWVGGADIEATCKEIDELCAAAVADAQK
jgi:multiple sugar transport system substrate-binding protein